MVALSVELQHLKAHLFGDSPADSLHAGQRWRSEQLAPVLDDKDQVNDKA